MSNLHLLFNRLKTNNLINWLFLSPNRSILIIIHQHLIGMLLRAYFQDLRMVSIDRDLDI